MELCNTLDQDKLEGPTLIILVADILFHHNILSRVLFTIRLQVIGSLPPVPTSTTSLFTFLFSV